MNLNPATVLNPVFNTLDALIQNYGVYLYLVFVWLSLGAIAWVLGGGLFRCSFTRARRGVKWETQSPSASVSGTAAVVALGTKIA